MSSDVRWGKLFEHQDSFKEARTIDLSLDLATGPSYTLVLVKPDGWSGFSNSQQGKRMLVSFFEPEEDTILLAWHGRYKTDIFRVTVADLDKMFEGWRECKGKYDFLKVKKGD